MITDLAIYSLVSSFWFIDITTLLSTTARSHQGLSIFSYQPFFGKKHSNHYDMHPYSVFSYQWQYHVRSNDKVNTNAPHYWHSVREIRWWVVDSPHKGPVIRKTLSCHDWNAQPGILLTGSKRSLQKPGTNIWPHIYQVTWNRLWLLSVVHT